MLMFVVMVMVVIMMMLMLLVVMVMMTCMLVLCVLLCHQLHFQGILSLDDLKHRLAGNLIPGRRDNGCLFIQLLHLLDAKLQLLRRCILRAAQNNRGGILNLIVEKFAESLHLLAGLGGIYHCDQSVQSHIVGLFHVNDGFHHIGKLAHTGGLDQNAVRMEFFDHFV